jgi:ubiquinone/menaquinone biosynthesis C-methylase UbiE
MRTEAVTRELTDDVVYSYWQRKAAESGECPDLTIRDTCFRDLEIDYIRRYLRPVDQALDIGCGNGFSTFQYARCVRQILGVDYSPNMIEAAGRLLEREDATIRDKTAFQIADARCLPFPDESSTRVIMERCLINIPDRQQQIDATLEAARVLKRGELMLLAEVTLQGHEQVNKYRHMFGLSTLKVHWHNTYLDEPEFLAGISREFAHEDTIRFGMYGFISKVVHPLLAMPDEPAFDAPINLVAEKIARQIPDFQGCSHQVLFVLRRK